jgi:hypothetical protein
VAPDHVLAKDISSFDGGKESYRAKGSVVPGATVIAEYDDGVPLFCTQRVGKGRVTVVNYYPVSSEERPDFWDANTDGFKMIRNAILFQ